MKFKYLNIIIVLLACFSLTGCEPKSGIPDLKETYNYKDARPFGSKVAYTLMKSVFPDKFVNVNNKEFSKFRAETYIDAGSFYFSVSKKFYCTEADADALLDYVSEGNTAFIAAAFIDTILMEKLYAKHSQVEWLLASNEGRFKEGKTSAADTFNYFYYNFYHHFTEMDSASGRVIGRNQAGLPNLVLLFKGKGRIYLHCDPRVFSNYFLLSNNNYHYLEQVMKFSKENPGNLFWDDYYNKKNYRKNKSSSALDILLDNPPLAMAFWLLLILLLLYILFNGKRKQRVIPIIPPVENTSVAFTQAIAGLYLSEKNNKTIADKMITYFNDHIRNRYFLTTHGAGTDFVQSLSKKSGVSFESVQALQNTIDQVQLADNVSDFELLTLNEQIQQFYKNRN